jgi:hypothetical protein
LRVVLQDANILDVFVPRVRQIFDIREEAYLFYLDYAKLAGFSVRTKRCNCNCWYRYKEMSSCIMGCSYVLPWLAEKRLGPYTRANVAIREVP